MELYALSDGDVWTINRAAENSDASGVTKWIGDPLSAGNAIVLALFPTIDATVAEALGRLVDACLKSGPFSWMGYGYWGCGDYCYYADNGFNKNNYDARRGVGWVPPNDPAACVEAINACVRRITNAK